MNVDSTAVFRDQIWFLTKDAESHHIYYRAKADQSVRWGIPDAWESFCQQPSFKVPKLLV